MEDDPERQIWELFEAIIWLKDVPPDLTQSARVVGGAAIRLDRLRYMRMRARARYWVDPARRESMLRYNREHADQIREYHRGWYDRNRTNIRAAAAAYRAANPEVMRQRDRDWRHSEAGRASRREQKRRARARWTPEKRAEELAKSNARNRVLRAQPSARVRDRERQREKARRRVRDAAVAILADAALRGLSVQATAEALSGRFDLRRDRPMIPSPAES